MTQRVIRALGIFVIAIGTEDRSCAGQPNVVTPEQSRESGITHWRSPASCGVSCCYVLLKLNGLNPNYEDVARLVPVEKVGSNFHTMDLACRQLGLNTEVIAATPADFERIRWPAIVHYRPMGAESDVMGHFVIVVGIDDHWVHILDAGYTDGALRIPRGDFFRQWSGHLLLPADARHVQADWVIILSYLSLVVLLAILFVMVWRFLKVGLKRSIASPAVSSPTLLILVLAILPVSLTACSRPIGATSSTAASVRAGGGTFDLTAWKIEAELGAIAQKGEAYAEFPIENTGSVEVELEAGYPSCSCSTITLDKRKLLPGETAKLRMALRRDRQAGLTQASVIVVAMNQKWAQSFRVRGTVVGSVFPKDKIVLTEKYSADQLMIRGKVFMEHQNEACDVAIAFDDSASWQPKDTLTVGKIDISEPKPAGTCFVREIAIPIAPILKSLAKLDGSRTTQLTVTVAAGDQKEINVIPFEITKAAP